MNEEHRKIIENAIKDEFAFRDKFFDFKVNSDLQFLLAQLNLFKTISTLVIALAGIGYLYAESIESQFLFISLCLAGIVFISSISYIREIIDIKSYQIKKIEEEVHDKTEIAINKDIKSLKEDDANIYFNFLEEQSKIKHEEKEPSLNYAGEVIIFLLYSSISFLILSYFGKLYSFGFFSWQTIVSLIVVYFLSFKSWAVKVFEILSKKL